MTGRVIVSRDILRSIREDVWRWPRRVETGGPLFGFESTDGLVVIAADPVQRAERSPRGFVPDPRDVKLRISHHYGISDGWHRYVGSWHTHPGGAPRPSRTDLRNAKRMAAEPGVNLPTPLFAIVATRRLPFVDPVNDVRFWRWSPESSALREVPAVWWSDGMGPDIGMPTQVI